MEYNFKKIEKKWQDNWFEKKLFKGIDGDKKKKYYVLEMFPYPSGRLHMGHVRNYTISDVISRYKRLEGYNVMHPIGWDAFGLPAENAAIKYKKHPRSWTLSNIETMKSQLKAMGFSYDWDREIMTCHENYYKWNQWLFIKMYEKGLVYRKKSVVNWCDNCETVLANEQVENGKCWRCDTDVIQKDLEQWFFRITKYEKELLLGHEMIKDTWPKRIIDMQKNWIGESEGTIAEFEIEELNEKIEIFTTRVDTIMGVTYLVIAPELKIVDKMIENHHSKDLVKNIIEFREKIKKQSELDRSSKEKEGCFTGFFAKHPLTSEKVPVWLGNYVLATYGTGAVMAVPAHDERDFDFAIKNKLEIKFVISNEKDNFSLDKHKAFTEDGYLINSGEFSGISSEFARKKITEKLIALKKGNFMKTFRLKDWLLSRQRYWGTPIPMVYCEKCGINPVKYEDLPLLLPDDVNFTGKGDSPLKYSKSFMHTKCPKCNGDALRDTDTMDTFVDSSWYFLRYCDPKNVDLPFSLEKTNYWMPVDQYVGGAEHACMHLLYSRFFEKVLVDLGLVDKKANEPFIRLLNQGMVIKDGSKMSKSKGNIVDPNEMIDKYGADSMRLFILFAAPVSKDLEWNEEGIEGCNRFLNRFFRLCDEIINNQNIFKENSSKNLEQMHNFTIKKILSDYKDFSYNTIIATSMEAVNFLYKEKFNTSRESLLKFIKDLCILLNPIIPHVTEEIWQMLGETTVLSFETLPQFDESKVEKDEVIFVIQINGKLRQKYNISRDMAEEKVLKIVLQDEKLKPYLAGKEILKKVFVKNKLLNLVIKN